MTPFGLAIGPVTCHGVTRVYPQSIFRSRKLRLAELIVGLQGFYFIPGPRNPIISSAKRYFGDHFSVHLVRTNTQETNAIDFSNARTEVALRANTTIASTKRFAMVTLLPWPPFSDPLNPIVCLDYSIFMKYFSVLSIVFRPHKYHCSLN